jgi:hypothetical protein
MMKRIRLYADTSVFGGCFDPEFEDESSKLFKEIRAGRFMLVLSTTTLRELEAAPEDVRRLLVSVPPAHVEFVALSEEIENLRDAYMRARILGASCLRDAEHIATASVANCDLVVSWNFKHIVHFDKIAGFNAVNIRHGYRILSIFSPKEVVEA